MSINQITSNYNIETLIPGQTQEPETKEDPLGRDAFLTMLVAQLEHQDPLNPMDGTDFTAQLAQFSSLEQMFDTNSSLEAILNALDTGTDENILDYIGKKVVCEDNTLRINSGEVSGGLYTIEEAADITITVFDDMQNEIATLYPGKMEAGTHTIDWSGYDRSGALSPDGTYHFKLTAVNDSGVNISVKTSATGIVTGVVYENGIPYLQVEGRSIDPSTVVEIWSPGDANA